MSELEKKRSETPQQAEAPFKSGEKGFAVFWLLYDSGAAQVSPEQFGIAKP